jgi:YjbE family integral membrane protein
MEFISTYLTPDALAALGQVIVIDLVLAGDNAIVIGLAAAGLPAEQRRKAILIGIAAATIMRIGFAAITVQLLAVIGLLLAGGILLLWVCWKMWRELRTGHGEEHAGQEALADQDLDASGAIADTAPKKTLMQASIQILIADVTMSLDNVLAVAGARARPRPVHRADGHRRRVHRQASVEASLDCLCRPRRHPLCGDRHDLARRP